MINKLKNLKSNQEFMKYFSNTSWLFFDKIFKMGVGFFVIIYLTRYLGPEKFGILSYSQSFVSIFMAFASLGISQILIRDLVNYPYKKNLLLGTTFILVIISSFIAILFANLIEYFLDGDLLSKEIVFILTFTIIFQNFNMIIDAYFQHKVLSKKIVISGTIGFIISSILKLYLIFIKAKLIYFAYALLFDVILLSFLFLYMFIKERESIFLWRFDFSIAKNFIKASIPLTMVAISAFIYTRIDQIMIKHIIDNEAIGNYAAAIKVSELFYFIPGIIVTSLFPKMVEYKKIDNGKYLGLIENIYRLVIWISIPIAVSISFFSDKIIAILYGDKFIEASHILSILSWGIIFASISAVFVKILYIEHWEKKYMYKNLFGVFLNTFLNYILIKRFGVFGASYATLFTLFAVNYIFDLFDKSLRKLYFLKIKPFIPKNINRGGK